LPGFLLMCRYVAIRSSGETQFAALAVPVGKSNTNVVMMQAAEAPLLGIQRLNGLRSRSRKQSAGRSHQSICYVIEIRRYGDAFMSRIRAMGIRDRPTAARSAWQNAYGGRAIGSIRRDCLDHVIVLGERHLLHLLRCYASYYNRSRTHLSLNKDAPTRRSVHALGSIEARPVLGGLHHF
jgi:hypothetical protein